MPDTMETTTHRMRRVVDRRAIANGTKVTLQRAFNGGQLTYTAPIDVEGQTVNVQVDTGSSDLVRVHRFQ